MNAGPTETGPQEVPSTARGSWGKRGLLRGIEEQGKSRGLGITQNCLQILCVSPTQGSLSASLSLGVSHVPDADNIYLAGCNVEERTSAGHTVRAQ